MSISIPHQLLKEDGETQNIKKILTFKSKKKDEGFKRKGTFNKIPEKVTTVNMYLVREGMVHLPYRFSRSYFSEKEKYSKFLEKRKYPKLFPDNIVDGEKIKGKKGKFKGTLRDYQVSVFQEAREFLKKEKTVTLALYPSFGKTFMGSMFAWYLNSYTLVLIHLETVAKAWDKTFRTYLDLEEDEIVMVDNKIEKKKKGKDYTLAEKGKIFICMHARIDKIPQFVKDKIRLLIIDEAHCFGTESRVNGLLSTTPEYVIVETATPERPDGLEIVTQSIAGEHFIERINDKPFKFYLIQTGIVFENDGQNVWTNLVSNQVESESRNKIILDLIERHQKYKTMIIANRKAHCKKLKEELSLRGLKASELYGTAKKYDPTNNILIGTGDKMGTGFDEKNFCDIEVEPSELLFILYTNKEKGAFLQKVGRGLRSKNPKIVMFCDDNSIVKRHFTNIKKWVKENKGEVIVVKEKEIPTLNF